MNLTTKDVSHENNPKINLSKIFPAIDSYSHLKKYTDLNNIPNFPLMKYINIHGKKTKIYYLTKNSNNYGIYFNNNKYIPPFMKQKNSDYFQMNYFYKRPKLNLDLFINKFILKNAPYLNKREILIKNFKILNAQFNLTQNRVHSSFERNNCKESNYLNNSQSTEKKETNQKTQIKKQNNNFYIKKPVTNTYQPQLQNDFIYDENNNAEFHFKSIRFFIGNKDPANHRRLYYCPYFINEKRKYCNSANRINKNISPNKNIIIDNKIINKRNISSSQKQLLNEEITDTTENMSKTKKAASVQKLTNNNEAKNIKDCKKILKKNNKSKIINYYKKEREDIRSYKTPKNGFKSMKHNRTSAQFFVKNPYTSKRKENNNDDIIKLI